jgi:hypothetical protein
MPISYKTIHNFIRIFNYTYLLQNYVILTYNKYFIILYYRPIPILINMHIWYFPRFKRIRYECYIRLFIQSTTIYTRIFTSLDMYIKEKKIET